jgi:GNAT superfamily N-acetyltransferase
MDLVIKTVNGAGIQPFLPDIARLRIDIFREFPYLYDGSLEYEQEYLETYIRSPRSLAVLVLDGQRIIGVSTGIPLADESWEFQKPFKEQGVDTTEIFYCGESILLPAYRGRGIYKIFFGEREKHAKQFHTFKMICFCAVKRPEAHPLRPNTYTPLDPVWESFGYKKAPELTTTYSWKDIDKKQEDEKLMLFWLKNI